MPLGVHLSKRTSKKHFFLNIEMMGESAYLTRKVTLLFCTDTRYYPFCIDREDAIQMDGPKWSLHWPFGLARLHSPEALWAAVRLRIQLFRGFSLSRCYAGSPR